MKFLDNLLLKYSQFCEKRRAYTEAKKIAAEKQREKYCLDNYGAYHNVDKLSRGEILDVFWRILEVEGVYDTSNFNANTSTSEPSKQSWEWGDLGCDEFVFILEEIFDLNLSSEECDQVETFGELADLIMKKVKEKNIKTDQQPKVNE